MVVDPAGSILMVAPERLAIARLNAIVIRKAGWIAPPAPRRRPQPAPAPREFVSGESVLYLGWHYRLKVRPDETGPARLRGGWLHVPAPAGTLQAARVRTAMIVWFRLSRGVRLPERVEAWRTKARVAPPRVVVADQRKRWGSYEHRGTIRLDWRLVQAPMRLVGYVVVRELVRLRHRGHGCDYWQAVGRVMADYERRREDPRRCGIPGRLVAACRVRPNYAVASLHRGLGIPAIIFDTTSPGADANSGGSRNTGHDNEWVRLFFVGGPEGSRAFCKRHGRWSYLTRRRRGEEGGGGGSVTGGAFPPA